MNIERLGKTTNEYNSREHGETERIRNHKVMVTTFDQDLRVNGSVFKDATLAISVGGVISAEVFHDDFTEDQKEEVSSWWYGENFA